MRLGPEHREIVMPRLGAWHPRRDETPLGHGFVGAALSPRWIWPGRGRPTGRAISKELSCPGGHHRTMKTGRLVLACHPRESGDPAFGLSEGLDSRLRGNDKPGRYWTVWAVFST